MMQHNGFHGKLPTKVDYQLSASGSRKAATTKQQEEVMKCPRCDSPNTKFCYYNNYSLSQPRHFCKTCRRYWTKGGALRNVPIGGGCRKSKKTMPSSRASCHSINSSGSPEMEGYKFFNQVSPTVDFDVGGGLPFLKLNTATNCLYNQISSLGNMSDISSATLFTPYFSLDPSAGSSNASSYMGINYPLCTVPTGAIQNMNGGSMNTFNTDLGSSVESLCFVNQDLLWKLQQQRFGTIFAGENPREVPVTPSTISIETQVMQKPQPILFQFDSRKLDVAEHGNEVVTQWLFGDSFRPQTGTPTNRTANENCYSRAWNRVPALDDLLPHISLP